MRRHLDRGVTVALVLAAGLSAAQLTPGTAGQGSSPSPGTGSGTSTSGTGTSGTTTPGTGTSGTTTPGTATPATPSPGTGTAGGNMTTPSTGTDSPGSLPPGPPAIAPATPESAASDPVGQPVSPAPAREPAQESQRAGESVAEAPSGEAARATRAPLTLAQLVERARSTDSRVEEATAELRKFHALYQQAKWAWFPRFEINVGVGGPVAEARYDANGQLTEASREGDLNFGRVGVTVYSTGNAVLPIYTFGKLTALEQAGAQGPKLGEALRERARDEAGFQAAQAYYGYQLARSGLQQLEDVSKRLEDAAERIDALLKEESEQVSQVDTYKVRFFRQLVEARRAEARQGLALALAAIRLLANAGPDEPVSVVDEDLALEEDVEPPTLERALGLAEQHRPEFVAISAGIAAREAEVFIRERSYYPDLGLAGFYDVRFTSSAQRQTNPFAYDPFNERTFGVGLVVRATFDIPIKDAQLEQARAELDKLRAQEKQIRAGLRLEVTKVHSELVAAWARAKAFTEAEKSARRWVTAAFAAFDLGTGETRDLVDAFTAYAQASGDRGKSWHDVRLGMSALERVTGTPPAPGE
ncbi:TolC family protein [Pyxidicoccus fallax]|uniref:TolC family protein n=1 Tax=Pyxidicoccus fallax TaxID=394095 RepID=A0A848LR91_9BACT|nr:TolC family protein [Pyxidicoccus fallax]NMO20415.1 TolC family protein [Pyxidicoccus fallax]NPC80996.1 TolC family protein [Pyxidicoccus fallax]